MFPRTAERNGWSSSIGWNIPLQLTDLGHDLRFLCCLSVGGDSCKDDCRVPKSPTMIVSDVLHLLVLALYNGEHQHRGIY